MNNLLILGAGGHGKVVADAARESGVYTRIAFLDDDPNKIGQTILEFDVIGTKESALQYRAEFDFAFIALGDSHLRMNSLKIFAELGFAIPVIIHPNSVISRFAELGAGTCVFANAVINADARIGVGCIINTGAVVEHDCRIGEGVHISCNTSLGGNVRIGDFSMIGIGSTIINNVSIGDNVMIGAGAVVTRDIPSDCTAVGIPAKPIKFHKKD